MTLRQKISAYTLGFLRDEDLPDIAIAALEEGYDSESLRILAGKNSNENPFKLVDYFKTALLEIGLTMQDKKSSLINLISYYAEQIINKQLGPFSGFGKIENLINATTFKHSDISLEKCYVDYISIWEVKGDGLQLHTGSGLTRQEYINRTEEELLIHLREWFIENSHTSTA